MKKKILIALLASSVMFTGSLISHAMNENSQDNQDVSANQWIILDSENQINQVKAKQAQNEFNFNEKCKIIENLDSLFFSGEYIQKQLCLPNTKPIFRILLDEYIKGNEKSIEKINKMLFDRDYYGGQYGYCESKLKQAIRFRNYDGIKALIDYSKIFMNQNQRIKLLSDFASLDFLISGMSDPLTELLRPNLFENLSIQEKTLLEKKNNFFKKLEIDEKGKTKFSRLLFGYDGQNRAIDFINNISISSSEQFKIIMLEDISGKTAFEFDILKNMSYKNNFFKFTFKKFGLIMFSSFVLGEPNRQITKSEFDDFIKTNFENPIGIDIFENPDKVLEFINEISQFQIQDNEFNFAFKLNQIYSQIKLVQKEENEKQFLLGDFGIGLMDEYSSVNKNLFELFNLEQKHLNKTTQILKQCNTQIQKWNRWLLIVVGE